MAEWKKLRIEDLAAPGKHSLATGPFGSAIGSRFFREEGVPVVRGSNLSLDVGERLIDPGIVFVEESKAEEFPRSVARRGDLIFTCWGTIGQIGLVDERARFDRYIVSNKQMKLTPDPGRVDSLFLYYALSSPGAVAQVQGASIGSSVPGFNLTQLRKVEVLCPPLAHQQSIAKMLGALDDKIAVNERITATAMGLGAAKAAQISASAMESAALGDILELKYGKALPASRRVAGGIPVYGSGGISGTHVEALLEGPGIIVGRKGTVGSVNWSEGGFFPIDTTFYVVCRGDRVSMEYAYFLLKRLGLENMNSDSAVPGLNRDRALSVRIKVPEVHSVQRFTAEARELFAMSRVREQENQVLAALRDTLLPQLMSGRLRVKDAEKIVEDHV
ncbi:restriction endonuclease subunit S [Streptomyces sp. SID4985]|uniref:restriction endonuclease subunit S n=1 Tax=Streptomyces sp. SID4985 TaxID=2690292 RepID=UPI00137169DC|nr:restriction endonuclease subunit S [Streptomyces sp. SID4985]MYQ49654.1 restriction endonuclease subunit S [Streptomyces sp. SID4985]